MDIMKKFAKSLGLTEDATDEQVEAALQKRLAAGVPASEAVMLALGARDERSALTRATEMQSLEATILALTGATSIPQAAGVLQSWQQSAHQCMKLAAEVSVLQKQVGDAKRDGLIEKLSVEGKLPPALHSWARTLTSDQLEVYAASNTFVGKQAVTERADDDEHVTLTDEDRKAAKALGMSNEKFIAAKKKQAQERRDAAA